MYMYPACMSRKRSNDLYFHCTFKGILYRTCTEYNHKQSHSYQTDCKGKFSPCHSKQDCNNHASLATYPAHNQELLRSKQIK